MVLRVGERLRRKAFHLLVVAPTEQVAKLYAMAHLERTPDAADAVRSAVKIEVRSRDQLVAIEDL